MYSFKTVVLFLLVKACLFVGRTLGIVAYWKVNNQQRLWLDRFTFIFTKYSILFFFTMILIYYIPEYLQFYFST